MAWYQNGEGIDYDSPRGGISIKTEKINHETKSTLLLTRVDKTDTGNYTCAPDNAEPVSVMVYIVNGKLRNLPVSSDPTDFFELSKVA